MFLHIYVPLELFPCAGVVCFLYVSNVIVYIILTIFISDICYFTVWYYKITHTLCHFFFGNIPPISKTNSDFYFLVLQIFFYRSYIATTLIPAFYSNYHSRWVPLLFVVLHCSWTYLLVVGFTLCMFSWLSTHHPPLFPLHSLLESFGLFSEKTSQPLYRGPITQLKN